MLAIKLKRVGKKRQPSYRVVVQPKRSKVRGNYVEDLGWYNPTTKEIKISAVRAAHWIKCGAQPTATVSNLLKKQGAKAK